MYINDNQFIGSVNLSTLPLNLTVLRLDNNQFSGSVDLSTSSTRTALFLTNNQFCGASPVIQVKCLRLALGCESPKRYCADTDATPNITCPPCPSSLPFPSTDTPTTTASSTPTPVFVNLTRTSYQNLHTLTITTTTSVVTAGGALLVIPPEVVVSTQMVQIAFPCKQAHSIVSANEPQDSSDSTLKRPLISLGRILPLFSSMPFKRGEDDTYEFLMLNLTVSTLYVIHFIIVLIAKVFSGGSPNKLTNTTNKCWKLKWIKAVTELRYPGLTLRYHVSIMLPLVATGISTGNYIAITIILLVMCFVFLALLCHMSYSPSRYITPPAVGDVLPNANVGSIVKGYFLECQGKWTPKISLSNGGPFFSQYTYSSTSYFKPYVWIWSTMIVGIGMVVGTQEVVHPSLCSSLVGVGSVYFVVSGIVHVVLRNTLMLVRGQCLLRGIRMIFCGLSVGFAMINTLVGGDSNETVVAYMICTYGMIVFSTFETMCGWLLLIKRINHSWRKKYSNGNVQDQVDREIVNFQTKPEQ
eukprot:PhF_6_TR39683/c0_g1_i3/m.58961